MLAAASTTSTHEMLLQSAQPPHLVLLQPWFMLGNSFCKRFRVQGISACTSDLCMVTHAGWFDDARQSLENAPHNPFMTPSNPLRLNGVGVASECCLPVPSLRGSCLSFVYRQAQTSYILRCSLKKLALPADCLPP